MSVALGNPPAIITEELKQLKDHLDRVVPKKKNDRLLICTWNIRAFGDITEKWESESGDSPRRDFFAVACIAEILSRFDVIAVQEVKENIRGLRYTMKTLGPDWGFLMTDVTAGRLGNGERLAFLYNTKKVKPSGLACELVIPELLKKKGDVTPIPISANTLQHQFARTPYAVSFLAGGKTFILTTMHVHYGDDAADRVPELEAIALWLETWARKSKAFGHNFFVLGDFNIDRTGDPLYDAFTSTGLYTPDDLNNAPRTVSAKPGKPQLDKHYDQIAWFNGDNNVPKLNMEYVKGGYVDFRNLVMKDLSTTSLSWRLSDHFPLWVEFKL